MHIVAIVVSTMIVVALVVFSVEYYLYRKHHLKPQQKLAAKTAAAEASQAPMTS